MALHKCCLTMYANDTSISYASKSIGELNTVINRDLACLNKWLQGNKMSLNVVKTQAMVIGSQPNLKKIADKRVDTPSFSTGDSVIDLVKNVKYLGVQLDSNLDWMESAHESFMQQGISCFWLFEICKEIRTERNSHTNVQRHCRATFSLLLFSVGKLW